jgi:hypothetical protein
MYTTSVILKMLQAEGIKISRQALNFFKKKHLIKERDYQEDTATTIYLESGKNQILDYYRARKSNS